MARKRSSRRPARKTSKRKTAGGTPLAMKKPGKRKSARKKPRGLGIPRKLAETDLQIRTLRRHVLEECVAVTSGIDTIPSGILSSPMREQWRRELEQAAQALTLVEQHLALEPGTEASR